MIVMVFIIDDYDDDINKFVYLKSNVLFSVLIHNKQGKSNVCLQFVWINQEGVLEML